VGVRFLDNLEEMYLYASISNSACLFSRPAFNAMMKTDKPQARQFAPGPPHSSVAQWQSIRLLTGGL
jgi:hypothetical protein